jgi:hypothetical protein
MVSGAVDPGVDEGTVAGAGASGPPVAAADGVAMETAPDGPAPVGIWVMPTTTPTHAGIIVLKGTFFTASPIRFKQANRPLTDGF